MAGLQDTEASRMPHLMTKRVYHLITTSCRQTIRTELPAITTTFLLRLPPSSISTAAAPELLDGTARCLLRRPTLEASSDRVPAAAVPIKARAGAHMKTRGAAIIIRGKGLGHIHGMGALHPKSASCCAPPAPHKELTFITLVSKSLVPVGSIK